MSEYTFTSDWFSSRIPTFKKYLSEYKGKPTKYIEIGVYEGRSSVWMLDNILTHKDSKVICIDPFNFSTGNKIYENFLNNIKKFGDKVDVRRGRSQVVLREFPAVEEYDIAYIDGEHTSAAVLENVALLFPMLKVGGKLIFDDYLWKNADKEYLRPKIGIDAFLEIYPHRIKVLHKGYHVIVEKTDH